MLDKQKIARTAEELARKGQFDKAIHELQRLVKEDPADDFAWLKLGDLFVKKGEPRQGARYYLQAAELYATQSPEKAIKVFQAVLSLDPTQVQCHQRLAALYHAAGQDREAMEQLEPYATFFEQNGKLEEAIQVRQRMLDLAPDYLPVRIKVAELYNRAQKIDEAVKEFARVAKQLKQMGRNEDYLKVLERLLFIKPDDKEHLFIAARTYLELKNPKEALGKLQGLFVLDPRNIDVLDLLAETFLALGQKAKAVRVLKEIARQRPEMKAATYQRILEVDPDDQDAQAFLKPPPARTPTTPPPPPPVPAAPGLSLIGIPSLPSQVAKLPADQNQSGQQAENEAKIAKRITEAELYIKYGLQEKAISHLTEVLDLNPNHKQLLTLLKDLYIGLADYSQAIPILLKLARTSPPEEAVGFLEQILHFDPQHKEAQSLYLQLGGKSGTVEEEIDDSDIIEDDDLLEEVAELVEQVEAQEEAALAQGRVRSPTIRPGATMIQMSPFYEVAEVIEPEERQTSPFQQAYSDPYDASQGAALYEAESFISEVTSRTTLDALQQMQGATQPTAQANLAAPGPLSADIEDSLAEADFFMQQGLTEDARAIIEDLLHLYPNDPRVQQRKLELAMGSAGRQHAVTTLDASFDSSTDAQPGAGSPFELGLAYRERGMIDEAVREFQRLLGTGVGDAICYHLIGVCYGDKGRYPEAIDAFKRALHVGGLSFEDELGIYYALGATHEAIGDIAESIYYYQRVYQREPRFRDVVVRLQQLQNASRSQRDRESGASPLPIRRDPAVPQAIARSRDDDDRYS